MELCKNITGCRFLKKYVSKYIHSTHIHAYVCTYTRVQTSHFVIPTFVKITHTIEAHTSVELSKSCSWFSWYESFTYNGLVLSVTCSLTDTVSDLQIHDESTQKCNTVPRAQWPAAGYEHIFNAGGENRSKCIFTLPSATVNVSSGQILRHYVNRSNINIFLCRARISLSPDSNSKLHSCILHVCTMHQWWLNTLLSN